MADPMLLETGAGGPTATPLSPTLKSKSPTQIALERLRADKVAIVCSIVVLFFVLVAVFADLITAVTQHRPGLPRRADQRPDLPDRGRERWSIRSA